GRLTDRLRKGVRAAGGVKDYLLTDFGFDDLVEAIRRPTLTTRIRYSAEVPAEKYRFRYAPGVPEEIARRVRAFTTNRQDSVLPLVQVVCTQLYELVRGRPDAVVGAEDLREIGGVEGGMDKHVGALILYLLPRLGDQEAFRRLLTHLCLSQPDGTLTTALVPADGLARLWRGRMPFGQLLEKAAGGEWRLLRVSSLQIGGDATERRYVSLGHDALAKVVVGWAEQRGRRARLLVPVLALTAFVCVLLVVGVSAIAVREVYRATTADVQRDIHGNLTRTAWYGKAAVERTLQEHVSFVEQHAAAVPDHIRTRLTLAAERAAADGPDAIPHRSTFDGWAADVMTDAKRRWPASYGRAVAVVLVAGDTPAGGLARGYTLTRAGGATAPVAERAAQPANYRTDWSFRDYFNGAGNDFKRKDRPHPVVRRTNVSHPYQSEQDGSWRLDVVTPVWSADRRVVALLSVSLHVDEHLRKPIDMPDSELREGQEVAKALGAYVVNDRGCWAWHEYGMEHLANDAKAGNFRDPDDLTALARAEAARRGMRPDDLVPWASADAGMRSDEDRYTDPVALAAGKDAPTMLAQTLLFHPYAHSTYPMLKDRAWGFVVQVPEEVAFAPVEEMKTNLVWAGSAVLFGLTAIIGPFVLAFRRIRQR
ncbi:MAG TPA: hypothetical protein VD866_13320, partial [Urbifossiella sp.]|nr:hypothetical protein [Urbifossiella sp.]